MSIDLLQQIVSRYISEKVIKFAGACQQIIIIQFLHSDGILPLPPFPPLIPPPKPSVLAMINYKTPSTFVEDKPICVPHNIVDNLCKSLLLRLDENFSSIPSRRFQYCPSYLNTRKSQMIVYKQLTINLSHKELLTSHTTEGCAAGWCYTRISLNYF